MVSVQELTNLNNRVAVITGGAGHLGFAMGEALGEKGVNLVVVDFNKKACYEKTRRLQDIYNIEAIPIIIDLNNEKEVRNLPTVVADNFNSVNILINCAALVGTSKLTGWITPFEDQEKGAWIKALDINLTAPFVMSQTFYPQLKKSGNGSIINISSIYGMVGPDMRLYQNNQMGNPAAYAVSKGGLNQLTRWLATVLAPEVRVNCITMGGVERGQPKSFIDAYVYRTPLMRMAKEDDIKGAAVFLASDAASYITGQNIIIDGGWTTW